MKDPGTTLITGASSGIGTALAHAYAVPGRRLALTGRDADRLAAVAESCRRAGAEVETAVIDVRDADALASWIGAVFADAPLDLAIANAGISAGTGGGGEGAEQSRRIFETNIQGVANTVHPAAARMAGQPARDGWRGQIALMASLAAFRGFPGAPAYCASKAAVKVLGEGLRGDLGERGIAVNVICPGYVVSAMTDANDFHMPWLMGTADAARLIERGIARNRARIAFPRLLYFGVWLLAALPPAITDTLLARLPKKV
jgi:short-subunit dehydrogenase